MQWAVQRSFSLEEALCDEQRDLWNYPQILIYRNQQNFCHTGLFRLFEKLRGKLELRDHV